jgi:predicted metalloenzyme YecM
MDLKYKSFLNELNKKVKGLGISLHEAKIDHIAYQTSSTIEYDKLKPQFEQIASLIREPIVGGRRVGVFKFKVPISYNNQLIRAIELIEPKKDQSCQSGLEHAEYLLPISLEKFIKKYPNINWNTEAINREEFPMLVLKLSENMQVKFPRFPVLG